MERIESLMEFVRSHPGFTKLSRYEKRLILLERYLTKYLDFNWNDNDPLGKLLERTTKEDYYTHSRHNLRLDQYIANEIKEAFGYNLTEFLELPTFFMEEILSKQRKVLKERRDIAEKHRREAARSANNLALPELGVGMHPFNSR